MPLLDIRDLRVSFPTPAGEVRVLDGISLTLDAGRTLGLVGESGCGKTMTALAIMRLLPPPGRIDAGWIGLDGVNLLELPEPDMRTRRGGAIGMVFQEPMSSLNPVLTIGDQVSEAIRLHARVGQAAARARTIEMLRLVEIAEPERRTGEYPHQLSGGMRQRVMLAIALACTPRLLIADEPTTALDVTIQAQILDLLGSLRARFGMAVLLVTHDLGVVAERTDEVAIMYAGRIVERAAVADLFHAPLHPYTRGLLASVPAVGAARRRRLAAIPGVVPELYALPSGCRFRDRCGLAIEACAATDPALEEAAPAHWVACIRAKERGDGDW